MSTDDRDDRWGDDDIPDRPAARREADPVAGRRKIKGPAIGLIATAVLSLGLVCFEFYQYQTGAVDAQMEEQLKQIDENKDIPADQKKMQKDLMKQVWGFMKPILLPLYVTQGLMVLLILFAGIRLLQLRGRGLGYVASILAMIPCLVSYGCLLGLPVGIWAIIALTHPDVKAAFAAARSAGRPDESDEQP